tara:strand:- start:1473 stop:1751 length:279 start_codon:yes stop_codon:yes gene_type:complete
MKLSELQEKQVALSATIQKLEEQLTTAKAHLRELSVLEADLIITKDIESGVHAAAVANRAVQEALDAEDNALHYPEGDPINDAVPATPPTDE